MGLDAFLEHSEPVEAKVDGEVINLTGGVRVGSYSNFHQFREEICAALEDDLWGSVYPALMDHSDCDGDYTPTESKKLLKEMNEITKKFSKLPHAKVDIFLDKKLKKSLYQFGPGYSKKTKKYYEMYGDCSSDGGFGVIISKEGLAVLHKAKFIGFFKKIEGVGILASGIDHKGKKVVFNDIENKDIFDNFSSLFDRDNNSHIGIKKAIFSHGKKDDANRYHLDLFRELAKASIKYKAKIVFC